MSQQETEEEDDDGDGEDAEADGDEDDSDEGASEEDEGIEEEEADIMDEDLTKLHDQMRQMGKPVGEEWLITQFVLPNDEALSQTMTISKKMESERQEKLNASAISYSRSRPLSPFAADNAFNLSKAGYANPGSLDRGNVSAAKKSRSSNLNAGDLSKRNEGQNQRGPAT